MTTLTITAKGQVTLKQAWLKHLGVEPGQKINVDTLPDGRAVIQAAETSKNIADAFGILKSKNRQNVSLTLEEIDLLSRQGWAGEK